MSNFVIETKDITKVFDKETAVDNLNLTVPKGSVFGLLGPNGAGKTTLIRMLMGIIKPTSGGGSILDVDILDTTGRIRQSVGYVSDFQTMYPFFRVEDIIGYCSRVYINWDKDKCKELLKQFDLPSNKWVRSLSKGMKTKLALLIALSIRPKVLILDEPTSGLDPVAKRQFTNLIMNEVAENNTTVFFSTHNLHDLERIADNVALIIKGKVLFNDSLDTVKQNNRKIQAVFQGELSDEIKNMPQILKIENQGRLHTILVREKLEETLDRLNKLNPIYIETIDTSLEEIFINTVSREGYGYEAFFNK